MSANVQPLIEYLQQIERKGETHVHLDETARKVLREFFLVAKGYKKHPSQVTVADSIASPSENTTPSTSQTQPNSSPAPEPTPATSQALQVIGNTPAEKIASLTSQAKHWTAAKALGSLREILVFSGGNPEADIMFITDAPGFNEETKGFPFAGPAGKKLDGILKAMGLQREQVYITHLVKYRPSMPNQSTANRKPNEEEIQAFTPFIQAEIDIVQPKVIISLGTATSQHLLDSENDIDQLRGKFHTIPQSPASVRVTYLPSYLLNNEALEDKRKLWEDMLAVMQQLNMPISDKQQDYFLPK